MCTLTLTFTLALVPSAPAGATSRQEVPAQDSTTVDPSATTTTSTSTTTTTTVPLRPVLPVPILTPIVAIGPDEVSVDGRTPKGVVVGTSDALADVALGGERYDEALAAQHAIAAELAAATDRIVSNQNRLVDLAAGQQALDESTRRAVARVAKLSRIRDDLAADAKAIGVHRYVSDVGDGVYPDPNATSEEIVARAHSAFLSDAAVRVSQRNLHTAQKALDTAIERAAHFAGVVRDVERESRRATSGLADAIKDRDRASRALPAARREVGRARANALVAGSDLPLVALDAYWRAAEVLARERPSCRIEWWALAGVGRSESNHARFGGGEADQTGRLSVAVAGLPLDGTRGTRLIVDSDRGALDGDPFVDRAVGAMQFIPGTWRRWARDGSGDGIADPQNIYDGALTAAVYLCNSGPGLDTDDAMRRAFFSYNRSDSYVSLVLSRARTYQQLPVPVPGWVAAR